jgi:sec-independent protein translocase protein TatA
MFKSIGPLEIGLIVLVILIVFGVGKLPQVGGAIGRGIHEFRKTVRGQDEDKNADTKAKADSEKEIKV